MPCSFSAYVDEAGDEGFGKLRLPGTTGQSHWLGVGAVLVSERNDRFMPSWRDEIVSLFPKKKNQRDLHFRHLNHSQRVAACNILREKPLGICVIASNKETILDSQELEVFKRKQHLYNYLVRWLLERLTAACREKAGKSRCASRIADCRCSDERNVRWLGAKRIRECRTALCAIAEGPLLEGTEAHIELRPHIDPADRALPAQ